MAQHVDCLIMGAGQAGLAMSQCLSARRVEHVVLERGRVGHRWITQRWPSLHLLTPGWMTRLPGKSLASREDGFLTAVDLAGRLDQYRHDFALPVIEGIDVLAVEKLGDRFRAVTSQGTWIARTIVIATGACDQPRIPEWGRALAGNIHQVASTAYSSAAGLPVGGVLVVGASATGIQLAAEIAQSGRETVIAAGNHVRAPRSYRGRDIFDWLDGCGFLEEKPPANTDRARLLAQPSLQLIGTDNRAEIDLSVLAKLGVRIAGRAVEAQGSTVALAGNLSDMLAASEARRAKMLGRIDTYISEKGISAPEDPHAWAVPKAPPELGATLDLAAEGIETVVWATGYRRNYSWLHMPVCDTRGELLQRGGICAIPGLFAIGLPFMRHRASTFIDGVGRDAHSLSSVIAAHLGADSSQIAA